MSSPPTAAASGSTGPVARLWREILSGAGPRARERLYGELAAMLAGGIAIREALHNLAERHGGKVARLLAPLCRAVDAGNTLGAAMRSAPDLFSEMEVSMVEAAERSGRLDQAFHSLASHMDRAAGIRSAILTGSLYPLLVLHLLLVCVPFVEHMAHGRAAAFGVAAAMNLVMLWGAGALLVSLHGLLRERVAYSRLLDAFPILGGARRDVAFSRFTHTFAALHDAGATMDVAVECAARATGDAWLTRELVRAVPGLRAGHSLSESLAATGVIPTELDTAVGAGEPAGRLSETVGRLGLFFEERFDRTARRLISLMPAVLVVLVAIPVGMFAYRFYVAPLQAIH